MKKFSYLLKRIIFLNFILLTVFAGKESGCECGNQLKSSSISRPRSSGKGKSSSSHGSHTNPLQNGTGALFSAQGNLSEGQLTPNVELDSWNNPFSSMKEWIQDVYKTWKSDLVPQLDRALTLSGDQLKFLEYKQIDRENFVKVILRDMIAKIEPVIKNVEAGNTNTANRGRILSIENEKFYVNLFNQVKEKRYENDEISFIKNVMDKMNTIYEEEDPAQEISLKIEQLVSKLENNIEKFFSAKKRVKKWMEEIWDSCSNPNPNPNPNSSLPPVPDKNKKFLIKEILEEIRKYGFAKKGDESYNYYVVLFEKVQQELYSNQANAINDIIDIINTVLIEGGPITGISNISNIDELVVKLDAGFDKLSLS